MIYSILIYLIFITIILYFAYSTGKETGYNDAADEYTNLISIQEQELNKLQDKYNLVKSVNTELRKEITNIKSTKEEKR